MHKTHQKQDLKFQYTRNSQPTSFNTTTTLDDLKRILLRESCSICTLPPTLKESDSYEEGLDIMICKTCHLVVHRYCYGIKTPVTKYQSGVKTFTCDACSDQGTSPYKSIKFTCKICQKPKGPLKKIADQIFVHLNCALQSNRYHVACFEQMKLVEDNRQIKIKGSQNFSEIINQDTFSDFVPFQKNQMELVTPSEYENRDSNRWTFLEPNPVKAAKISWMFEKTCQFVTTLDKVCGYCNEHEKESNIMVNCDFCKEREFHWSCFDIHNQDDNSSKLFCERCQTKNRLFEKNQSLTQNQNVNFMDLVIAAIFWQKKASHALSEPSYFHKRLPTLREAAQYFPFTMHFVFSRILELCFGSVLLSDNSKQWFSQLTKAIENFPEPHNQDPSSGNWNNNQLAASQNRFAMPVNPNLSKQHSFLKAGFNYRENALVKAPELTSLFAKESFNSAYTRATANDLNEDAIEPNNDTTYYSPTLSSEPTPSPYQEAIGDQSWVSYFSALKPVSPPNAGQENLNDMANYEEKPVQAENEGQKPESLSIKKGCELIKWSLLAETLLEILREGKPIRYKALKRTFQEGENVGLTSESVLFKEISNLYQKETQFLQNYQQLVRVMKEILDIKNKQSIDQRDKLRLFQLKRLPLEDVLELKQVQCDWLTQSMKTKIDKQISRVNEWRDKVKKYFEKNLSAGIDKQSKGEMNETIRLLNTLKVEMFGFAIKDREMGDLLFGFEWSIHAYLLLNKENPRDLSYWKKLLHAAKSLKSLSIPQTELYKRLKDEIALFDAVSKEILSIMEQRGFLFLVSNEEISPNGLRTEEELRALLKAAEETCLIQDKSLQTFLRDVLDSAAQIKSQIQALSLNPASLMDQSQDLLNRMKFIPMDLKNEIQLMQREIEKITHVEQETHSLDNFLDDDEDSDFSGDKFGPAAADDEFEQDDLLINDGIREDLLIISEKIDQMNQNGHVNQWDIAKEISETLYGYEARNFEEYKFLQLALKNVWRVKVKSLKVLREGDENLVHPISFGTIQNTLLEGYEIMDDEEEEKQPVSQDVVEQIVFLEKLAKDLEKYLKKLYRKHEDGEYELSDRDYVWEGFVDLREEVVKCILANGDYQFVARHVRKLKVSNDAVTRARAGSMGSQISPNEETKEKGARKTKGTKKPKNQTSDVIVPEQRLSEKDEEVHVTKGSKQTKKKQKEPKKTEKRGRKSKKENQKKALEELDSILGKRNWDAMEENEAEQEKVVEFKDEIVKKIKSNNGEEIAVNYSKEDEVTQDLPNLETNNSTPKMRPEDSKQMEQQQTFEEMNIEQSSNSLSWRDNFSLDNAGGSQGDKIIEEPQLKVSLSLPEPQPFLKEDSMMNLFKRQKNDLAPYERREMIVDLFQSISEEEKEALLEDLRGSLNPKKRQDSYQQCPSPSFKNLNQKQNQECQTNVQIEASNPSFQNPMNFMYPQNFPFMPQNPQVQAPFPQNGFPFQNMFFWNGAQNGGASQPQPSFASMPGMSRSNSAQIPVPQDPNTNVQVNQNPQGNSMFAPNFSVMPVVFFNGGFCNMQNQ